MLLWILLKTTKEILFILNKKILLCTNLLLQLNKKLKSSKKAPFLNKVYLWKIIKIDLYLKKVIWRLKMELKKLCARSLARLILLIKMIINLYCRINKILIGNFIINKIISYKMRELILSLKKDSQITLFYKTVNYW